MKKFTTILFILLFSIFFSNVNKAQFNLGAFFGYGMSAFENFTDNAGYIPMGLQAYYSFDKLSFGSLNFGVEFNYSVVPFTFEAKAKIKQMIIAALIKVKFLKASINPFVRLGAGLYTGGSTLEWTDIGRQAAQQQGINPVEEIKFDSAFGFNVGAGADYKFGKMYGVFLEFLYHIVSRKPENAQESGGANNWAVQAGFQVAFGK